MRFLAIALFGVVLLAFTPHTGAQTTLLYLPVSVNLRGIPADGEVITIGSKTFVFSTDEPLEPYVWVRLDNNLTKEDVANRLLLAIEAQVGHTSSDADRCQSTATLIMLVSNGTPAIEVSSESSAFQITELGMP